MKELLRGGYRKTHFQADQTILQNVSQMGAVADGPPTVLTLGEYKTFIPCLTQTKTLV